jgi:hypothetical protein
MTVSETDINECAQAYEWCCHVAARRARQLAGDDDDQFRARMTRAMNGVRAGVAMELRERGCPESELLDTLLVVAERAVHIAAVRNSAGTA